MRKIIFTLLLLFQFSTFHNVSTLKAESTENAVIPTAAPESRTLKGTVVDENNEGLIGAVVKIKGTTNGVLCDLDGNFTLNDVPSGAILTISYMGYESQEVPVNGRSIFKIKMQPTTKNIQEEVVTAMGILRK